MTKTTGFLYGHYDSRGGATFIPVATREEADRLYASIFMHHNGIFDSKEEADEADKQVCEEDFLGAATVESPTPLEDGQDIEYDHDPEEDPSLWVREFDSHYELVVSKECPGDGFEPSQLGEDAYGVIIQTKELEYERKYT